jgi:hypothetical protein
LELTDGKQKKASSFAQRPNVLMLRKSARKAHTKRGILVFRVKTIQFPSPSPKAKPPPISVSFAAT